MKVYAFLASYFLFACLSAVLHASEDVIVIDRFDNLDIKTSHPGKIEASFEDSSLVASLDCSELRQLSVSVPFDRRIKDQKVLITLGDSSNVSYIGKIERLEDGTPIPGSFEHTYIEYQKGPVSFSLDNKHHDYLTFYFVCIFSGAEKTGTARIEKIEIVPLEFSDDRDFAYILTVLLLIVFLTPGLLTYTACVGEGGKIHLLALLTPLSLIFFIALYPVLLAHQLWSPDEAGPILLGAYITANLMMFAWIASRGRLGTLARNLSLIRLELLAVAIAVLCVSALLTEDLDLPLYTFNHLHLRYLTYEVFYAHDPIFQYVNGIAIYHDEPFIKYYADGKLVYAVQDRGITAGVIYAVLRGIATPFNTAIAYGSGYYSLFGALLNALVLLPLFAIHAYFFAGRARPLMVLLLVAASGFMVSNILITWYKLAGAGLVISGIAVLLAGGPHLRQWAVAGVLWGLATNFHPGLALTYPLVTLWLLGRYYFRCNRKLLPVVLAFFTLLGTFVVVNLPWSVVKATYYEDTNALFRQHFLGFQRYDPEHGVVGSIENFIDRYSLDKQLTKRTGRLIHSLRTEEMAALVDPDKHKDWEDLLFRWNALETSYLVFVLTPLVVLLMLAGILSRLLPAANWKTPLITRRGDFLWLLATQVLTILLIIFASFGPFEPDINWHIPMSCTVLVIYLLAHATVASGRIGASLIVAYALFTYYRLFFQYF